MLLGKKNMQKHNRKSPPGTIELGKDLLLGFRIVDEAGGNAGHSRRALSMEG